MLAGELIGPSLRINSLDLSRKHETGQRNQVIYGQFLSDFFFYLAAFDDLFYAKAKQRHRPLRSFDDPAHFFAGLCEASLYLNAKRLFLPADLFL